MSVIYTMCPVVRKTTEELGDYVVFGGERQLVTVAKEIHWVRESASKILFMHGDREIKSSSGFSDYYGYLESIYPLECEEICKRYKVDQGSSLEIRMVTTIEDHPLLEIVEDDGSIVMGIGARIGYRRPEGLLCRKEDGSFGRRLESAPLCEEVTWSSKRSAEENSQFIERFKKKWAVLEKQ